MCLDQINQEITQEDLRIYWDMNLTTFELKRFNDSSESSRFYLLFEHYYHQDILSRIATKEEIEFAMEIAANEEELRNSSVDNDDLDFFEFLSEQRILNDLEAASKILAKYKHPSIFGNIYDDPTATCGGILEFFDQHDQLKKFLPYYEQELRLFQADEILEMHKKLNQ